MAVAYTGVAQTHRSPDNWKGEALGTRSGRASRLLRAPKGSDLPARLRGVCTTSPSPIQFVGVEATRVTFRASTDRPLLGSRALWNAAA